MIKVDIRMVQKYIKSKKAFEAFCLAVLFKGRFGNSLIYNHSVRELKEITHLGTDKLKRCIKNGYSLGFYSIERSFIRVKRVHIGSYRFIKVRRDASFKEIVTTLRKGLILNMASQAKYVKDIIDKAAIPDRPLSKKEIKAYKDCRNYVDGDTTRIGTITKDSFAKCVRLSRTSVNNIIRQMKSEHLMAVRPCLVPLTNISGKLSLNEINLHSDEWYVTRRGDQLYRQVGNYYTPLVEVK